MISVPKAVVAAGIQPGRAAGRLPSEVAVILVVVWGSDGRGRENVEMLPGLDQHGVLSSP